MVRSADGQHRVPARTGADVAARIGQAAWLFGARGTRAPVGGEHANWAAVRPARRLTIKATVNA
jgi:hypothetical protein